MKEWKTISLSEQAEFKRLRRVLGRDVPKNLDYVGNIELLSQPSVGFCGSRKATDHGLATAEICALESAREGLVIVSGNASGVDRAAHKAALASGNCTVFVLPEGISRFKIRRDFKEIWDWKRVLVVSQWPSNAVWRSYQAMARNNTIIGLSDAMIVVEAGISGGTRHAGDSSIRYGVPLFVVEYGEITEEREGNRALIASGGIPLRRTRGSGKPSLNLLFQEAKDHFHSERGQSEMRLDE